METTDGYEAKYNDIYFLSNGAEVIFNEGATTPEGKKVFLVIPIYEGETMEASGDGGSHHEISMNYEHEGEQTLVSDIFKHPPTEKIEEIYKTKLTEIKALSLTIFNLTNEKKELSNQCNQNKSFMAAENLRLESIKTQTQKANEDLNVLLEKIKDKRLALSIIDDSIVSLSDEDESVTISIPKKELARLRKTDFKMDCLEAGGIDNWEWYDESLENFRERYPS